MSAQSVRSSALWTSSIRLFLLTFSFLSLLTPGSVSAQAQDFFPIGIFNSGIVDVYPVNNRAVFNHIGYQCYDPSSIDTTWYAKEWSCLDEVRGNTITDTTYGYTSGFNIVHSYVHAQASGGPRWLYESQRFLYAAHALGFKVLLNLPSIIYPAPYYPCWVNSLEAQYTAGGDSLIHTFKNNPDVYGWWIADEPMNLTDDEGFHHSGISAEHLRAAYTHFKTTQDSTHPYVFALPDYPSPNSVLSAIWGPDPVWRWDNTSPTSHTFSDPGPDDIYHSPSQDFYCHGTRKSVTATQDYSNAADMIGVDTYMNPHFNWAGNQAGWNVILRQYDIVDSTNAGGFQAFLSCSTDNAPGTLKDGAVWYNNAMTPCFTESNPGVARFQKADLRYQIYTAIIHAAKGIWFYSYTDTFDPCTSKFRPCARTDSLSPYFASTVAPLSLELKGIENFLKPSATVLGRKKWSWKTQGETPWVSTPGDTLQADWLQLALLKQGTQLLLIAANVSASPISACVIDFNGISDPQVAAIVHIAKSAEVLFEGTAYGHEPPRSLISFNSGVVTDSFDAREVHLYRIGTITVPG